MKAITGFFQWIGTALEEDSGKVSIKRVGFLILICLASFVVTHYTVKDVTGTYDWMNCLPTLVTLLSAAFTLVGLSYVPTRFGKNTPDKDTDAPKV